MKQIPLFSRNSVYTVGHALVDDSDYEFLTKFSWLMSRHTNVCYAVTYIEGQRVYMHQLILSSPDIVVTPDHKNGNGLDNQRDNLRLATRSQQKANSTGHPNSRSGFKGVYYTKKTGRWRACITCKGVSLSLGQYATKEDAAKAYNDAAAKYFGEFAKLNVINDQG